MTDAESTNNFKSIHNTMKRTLESMRGEIRSEDMQSKKKKKKQKVRVKADSPTFASVKLVNYTIACNQSMLARCLARKAADMKKTSSDDNSSSKTTATHNKEYCQTVCNALVAWLAFEENELVRNIYEAQFSEDLWRHDSWGKCKKQRADKVKECKLAMKRATVPKPLEAKERDGLKISIEKGKNIGLDHAMMDWLLSPLASDCEGPEKSEEAKGMQQRSIDYLRSASYAIGRFLQEDGGFVLGQRLLVKAAMVRMKCFFDLTDLALDKRLTKECDRFMAMAADGVPMETRDENGKVLYGKSKV